MSGFHIKMEFDNIWISNFPHYFYFTSEIIWFFSSYHAGSICLLILQSSLPIYSACSNKKRSEARLSIF
ncbi:unnamed protein product [Blepharisma stoltei]|uniref:Uncharacterized protein n=1 Tax=Blepharisma stoltei TaxID=1481888 RepID=A0AAU9JYC3_9CILI|nr:unnamed protein product [Blepharisma stoltei]